MRLDELAADLMDRQILGEAAIEVTSLCYRSDDASPGSLFFCVPGFTSDGHDFAADVVERGATALCVERRLALDVAQVVVPSVRRAMGPIASKFYGNPSETLLVAGITGTNGKTTSAFLVAHLLERAGIPAGLMGTVERRIGGEMLPAGRTTPEAVDIQRDLAQMVTAGDKAVVMEVSSHALDLGRTLGMKFDAIAFTNLTQDHLDYHKTIEDYFAAKSLLFLGEEQRRDGPMSVINVDDPYGLQIATRLPRDAVFGVSTSKDPGPWGPAELEWSDYSVGPDGARGTVVFRGRAAEAAESSSASSGDLAGVGGELRVPVATRLLGDFNVANSLVALGIGLALGLDAEKMLYDLAEFKGVPGRMEPVDVGQEFLVLVDYAHTPDSVRNALETAKGITKGRLVAVIGCGGDRDRGKRPLMGREAERVSDLLFVTSDNPRSEDPMTIIDEILAGLEAPRAARVEPDRRKAIAEAVAQATTGDVVVVLGKGHESGQEIAGRTLPFDDREVARAELTALLGGER